jgi:hypothetical protein
MVHPRIVTLSQTYKKLRPVMICATASALSRFFRRMIAESRSRPKAGFSAAQARERTAPIAAASSDSSAWPRSAGSRGAPRSLSDACSMSEAGAPTTLLRGYVPWTVTAPVTARGGNVLGRFRFRPAAANPSWSASPRFVARVVARTASPPSRPADQFRDTNLGAGVSITTAMPLTPAERSPARPVAPSYP